MKRLEWIKEFFVVFSCIMGVICSTVWLVYMAVEGFGLDGNLSVLGGIVFMFWWAKQVMEWLGRTLAEASIYRIYHKHEKDNL